MQFRTSKQIDVSRLKADLADSTVELLSAHCATDRVRLRYSVHDIAAYGERAVLKKAITYAQALHDFFSQIDHHIKLEEKTKR